MQGSDQNLASTMDLLRSKLSAVKKSGKNSFTARCPAHNDQSPSLSVTLTGDKILCQCFAGCSVEAICSSVGIPVRDLFANEARREGGERALLNSSSEVYCEYQYVDSGGNLSYIVTRSSGKQFRQHRVMSDGSRCPKLSAGWYRKVDGRWLLQSESKDSCPGQAAVWLDKVEPLLFRLPSVVAAAGRGETIYVCEGEKDVLTLERMGAVATTNSGGAGKWKDQFSKYLVGSKVKIIADNDPPGINHATQVSESLARCGIQSEILIAKSGKDATDHFQNGFALDDFVQYRFATRPHQIVSMLDIQPEVINWLWKHRIPFGAVSLLLGDPGKGKTRTALAIAAAISRGEILPENDSAVAGRVLILTLEEPTGQIRKRLDELGADLSKIDIVEPDDEFRSEPLEFLKKHVSGLEYSLIIFDPLQCFVSPKADMQVANKSRHEMAKFISLAESTGAAILIICHPNKQSGNNDLYRVSGSLDIVAAARSAMYLREVDDKLALCQIKSNLGPKASSIEVMISEEGCVSFGDLLEEPERPLSAVENATRFLVAQLSSGPLLSDEVHALAKIMGISKSSIDRAKKSLGARIGARKRSDGAWELHLTDTP